MENASKALIMAGSVLLSMIIIGALVFMFNNLRQVKQGEVTSEDIKKLTEYNKKIETFNRNLYGSELISLANFIADYETRLDIGSETAGYNQYDPIKLTVNIRNRMVDVTRPNGTRYQTRNTAYTNYKDLVNDFNKLQSEVEKEKNTKIIIGRRSVTVEKLAGMRDSEINQLIEEAGGNTTADVLREKTQLYLDLKLELTNFKNRRFKVINMKYSPDNNRIIKLEYEELPA